MTSILKRLFGAPKAAPQAGALPDDRLTRQMYRQLTQPRRAIEMSIDNPADAAALMERVIAQWRKLGDSDPFWSNDTREEFKRGNLTEARIDDFYAGGVGAAGIIDAFESRSGVAIANGTCVELGCGVGKHTHVLARRFAKVFAIDVSAGGLAICAERMQAFGLTNVETVLLTDPGDLGGFGATDLFFCLSVLQHNPPPIQKMMLEQALASLRPGGFCLFQTPDTIEDYAFSCARFLHEPDAMFDLHCLPKTEVLAILDAGRMRLLDFAPDLTVGSFGSYTYFGQKRA